MSRPLRIQFPEAVYHVMNRGATRQPTFADDGDYQAFLDTLAEAHRLWGIEVFAYSLMGNHYHLCLRTPNGNLSRVMRHVDGIYTQRFNRHHRRDGTLFRGRYKAILIDAEEYLAAVVRYIHLNAVEAGIVKMPEDYRWASHRYYHQARGVPNWLNTEEVVEQIGVRQGFHEFVLSGNEESLKRYYEAERHSPILGSEEFIERVRQPVAALAREYARYERRVVQAGPERVVGEVARQYKVTREEIFQGKRGKENEARKVAMYLVRRCCDRTLPEIAKYFGTGSYSAVTWSCRQIEARMAREKKLRDWIKKIAASIHQLQT
jgi:REP element-mobilizing transposase RayT